MELEFQEYNARKIVNIHKHTDGPWFWDRYSAHPYVGCRSGCAFCYERGGPYLRGRDPDTFDTVIRVKTNAVARLREELARLPPDIIACGDWQRPAEDRYQLSRAMLEVVLAQGFPLFVIERSPLLTRDLDLLTAINERAWAGVAFSVSSVDPALKQAFEPRSPGVKQRFQAMATLAQAGILVGTALMPVLPGGGDAMPQLEAVVRATKEHGGAFVLAGGLTMSGAQAVRTLEAARQLDPELELQWRAMYHWEVGGKPDATPPRAYSAQLGRQVRELCARYGLQDRIPRYVVPGALAVNKRIAERLFLKTYDLELEEAATYRIWAYRKAAWTVDDWEEPLDALYAAHGEAGLRRLPGVGKSLGRQIAAWLESAEL